LPLGRFQFAANRFDVWHDDLIFYQPEA
jgi:hypothetical protein